MTSYDNCSFQNDLNLYNSNYKQPIKTKMVSDRIEK